jgi:hypothetical protein
MAAHRDAGRSGSPVITSSGLILGQVALLLAALDRTKPFGNGEQGCSPSALANDAANDLVREPPGSPEHHRPTPSSPQAIRNNPKAINLRTVS